MKGKAATRCSGSGRQMDLTFVTTLDDAQVEQKG